MVLALQSADPFFSNDLQGLLKVLGLLAAFIVPTWAFIWKILEGPLQRRFEKDSEAQIGRVNGLGRRVKRLESSCTTNNEAISNLKADMALANVRSSQTEKEVAELRESIRNLTELTSVHKTEIIEAFQKRTNEVMTFMHDLDKNLSSTVAVLKDREQRADGNGGK